MGHRHHGQLESLQRLQRHVGNWNQAAGTDIAVFSNTAGLVTLSGGVSANQLRFASDGYTVTNSILTMAGAGLFDVAPNSTATVYSTVAGAVVLVKTNTGTLVFPGSNTFTTVLTIREGVVNARTSYALGNGAATVVSNGAALQVQDGTYTAEPLTLNGSGIANDGALRSLSGITNKFSTVTVNSDARVNCDAGVLFLNGTVGLVNGATLTVGGSGTTRIQHNISGTRTLITGAGGLIKDGTGRLLLGTVNAVSAYTGATQVIEGTLQAGDGDPVSNGGGLSPIAPLILGGGTKSGTLDVWLNSTVSGLGTSGSGTSNTIMCTNASTKTFTLSSLSADAFSGQISGNLGLIKNDTGTLTLSGSNTYSGGTTVGNGATLALDCSADNNSKLGTGATTLQGATLTLMGNSSADTAQNLNNVTFNTGHSAITVTSGGGQSATLNLGTIARTAPGTVEFVLPASGSITTATAVANGTLGGYATIGSDWVAKSGTALMPAVNYASFPAVSTSTNELLTTSGSLSGAKTLNSLKITTSGAGQSLNLGANTLTFTSRGLLFAGADNYTIEGTGLLGSSGNELIVHAKGSGLLAINAPISGGGGSLVKVGAGTVSLGANSVYTGTTTINQGVLRMGVAGAIGALSPVTVRAGATWDLDGNAQTVGALSGMGTVALGTASLTSTSSANTAFSGVLQGASGGTFVKTGSGTLTFDGTMSNTFTGPINVLGGVLTLSRRGYMGIAGDVVIGDGINPATLNLSYSEQIADTASVTVNRLGQLLLNADATYGGPLETIGLFRNLGGYVYVQTVTRLTVSGIEMTGGTNKVQDSTGNTGKIFLNGDMTVNAASDTAWFLTDNASGSRGQLNLNGTNRTFAVADGAAAIDLHVAALLTSSAGGVIKTGAGHMRIGINTSGYAATYAGNTEVRDGVVSIGIANGLPTARALSLGGSSGTSGTLDLNGFDQTIGGLASDGNGAANTITNSVAANVTFTINTTTSTVYRGAIGDNAAGIVSLVKNGTGTQELWGSAAIQGRTTSSPACWLSAAAPPSDRWLPPCPTRCGLTAAHWPPPRVPWPACTRTSVWGLGLRTARPRESASWVHSTMAPSRSTA